MELTADKTVAEVVTENIKTAHIFKKYGIDFCCGGGNNIEKACAKNNLDYTILEKELTAVDKLVDRFHDYDNWDLNFLINHIINVHHKYVQESIPILLQYAAKVAKVHGHHYTEVIEIESLVKDIVDELSAHMKKEELILFPYIKQLVQDKEEGARLSHPHFGSVVNPIQMMESEHENAGDVLKRIAKLSNDYTPPPEACNTFRAFYAKLEEFELDLHQHIHLENNILHPKAILLEKNIES